MTLEDLHERPHTSLNNGRYLFVQREKPFSKEFRIIYNTIFILKEEKVGEIICLVVLHDSPVNCKRPLGRLNASERVYWANDKLSHKYFTTHWSVYEIVKIFDCDKLDQLQVSCHD